MICVDLSTEFACLRLEGSTRVDYLQRLGSGDVNGLREGQGAATCLLTPIGRMVDRVIALGLPDALLLVCSAAHKDKLHRWLRKFIFFNDDVRVVDPGLEMCVHGVFGAGADALVDDALRDAPLHTHTLRDAPLHAHTLRDANFRVVKTWPMDGAGYWLIGPQPSLPPPNVGLDAYHVMRIAHGIPAAPAEISEDYIPLEAGLWGAVSFRKGCYTGQEIIARMESRNTVPRKLYVLHAQGAQPGHVVQADGVAIGSITSASAEHALAYLRLGTLAENAQLSIGDRAVSIMRAVSV